MTNKMEGAWELVSGQPLPKGVRDIKILSDGHFMFSAYDTNTGNPNYVAGGTYTLDGESYVEHMTFASDKIPKGLVGKDQFFTVNLSDDEFTQEGVLSNGKELSEKFRRLK
jgi:hypothetical protein